MAFDKVLYEENLRDIRACSRMMARSSRNRARVPPL
jgi:hypothetical protein